MRYKLIWKPKFSQQSQNIVANEEFSIDCDAKTLEHEVDSRVANTRALISSIGRPYRVTFGQILAGSFVMQVISISSVLLAAETLKEDPWLAFPLIAGIYLSLRAAHTLLNNWIILNGNRMAAEMTGNLTLRLGHHISQLAPEAQKNFSSGNLKTMAITDVQTVSDIVHSLATRGVGFVIAPFIAPFILFHLASWPGIWAYGSMLLMIPFSFVTSRRMMRFFDAELKLEDECTTVMGEWLKNQKAARMMLANDFFEKKIGDLKRGSFAQARLGMYWAAFIFGTATRWWVVPPLVMIVSAQFLDRRLGMDVVVGSLWYLTILTGQLMSIPDLIVRGGKAMTAFKRIAAFLQQARLEEALIPSGKTVSSFPFRSLHLNQVYLSIDGKNILSDISLSIDLRMKTAIIGQVGAGKSSLLSLMSGHLFPSEGSIALEGIDGTLDIREQSVYQAWRRQQVLVAQEPFIETSDIKSNVKLRHESGDCEGDTQLLQSLYDAAMQADLAQFQQGINERIGETGINLSGGQKQRLSLARAIYSQRSFLFLDDPFSAVDEAVADQLWDSIVQTGNGFVISTHRRKYIESCDQVIVMEGGRIKSVIHPRDLLGAAAITSRPDRKSDAQGERG